MTASEAVKYAHLVGLYVRMEREPSEVEYLEESAIRGGEVPVGYKVGCEGVVVAVWDSAYRVGGPAVEIMMDYGMGFPVFPDESWQFFITDTRQTMESLGVVLR